MTSVDATIGNLSSLAPPYVSPLDSGGFDEFPDSTQTTQVTDSVYGSSGHSVADIIGSVGNVVLSGLVLSRTPTNKLPQVNTVGGTPMVAPRPAVSTININVIVIGLAIVAVFVFFLSKKGG
jgi:hypothetical protein